ITCVKITPYEIDNNQIAFESTIIIPLTEAKDYLIEVEKKENTENIKTLTQEEYIKFYGDLRKELESVLGRKLPDPKPKHFYQIPSAINGVHFEWVFYGRINRRFYVALDFETNDREFNKSSVEKLEMLKSKIEQETNEEVIFQKDRGNNWTRIYIMKDEGKMSEDLKEWAVKNMKIFIDILEPEISKLSQKIQE
ncbi:MAG: DUF4268 domain-containing protein, partial [Deltaproteobacteria bacterium]|nr:DUF4268 domain-containing protein [Deltaproteobacteria bacterium]